MGIAFGNLIFLWQLVMYCTLSIKRHYGRIFALCFEIICVIIFYISTLYLIGWNGFIIISMIAFAITSIPIFKLGMPKYYNHDYILDYQSGYSLVMGLHAFFQFLFFGAMFSSYHYIMP